MIETFKIIQEAYCLLDLEDDWDDDGANKAIPEAFNKAMLFIHLLITKIGFNLPDFEIDLARDGNVYVNFKTKSHSFLIIFSKEKSSCYGSNNNNGDIIKNYGEDLKTEEIIKWFKKHMLNDEGII